MIPDSYERILMKKIRKRELILYLFLSGLIITALAAVTVYSHRMLRENRFGEYYLLSPESEPWDENDQYWADFHVTENYDKAMAVTEEFLKKYPYSLDGMLNKAYLLISLGEYEEGILLNQKAIEIHGRNSTAYNNIGWAHINMDRYELGIYYLEQAIEVNGGRAEYAELINLGDAYQGLLQYEKAVEYYLQAITDFPEEAVQIPLHCYIGLSETYRLLEQEEQALEIYHRILELDPVNYNAFFEAVSIYKEQDNVQQVLVLGKRYFEHEPEPNYAYSYYASILYDLEQYTEAAEYYVLYAAKTDYPAYGYYQAARSYARAGNEELSGKYMELCLQYDSDYLDYMEEDDIGGWSDD